MPPSAGFVARQDFRAGDEPEQVVVGDFTSNRIPGGFRSAPDYLTGKNASAVVAGDFERDGLPDLTVANCSAGTVSILLNDV